MAWAAALAEPPFSALEEAVRDYALEALNELGPVNTDDVVDILSPFLLDAGLAADERCARALCLGLAPLQAVGGGHANAAAPPPKANSTLATPLRPIDVVAEERAEPDADFAADMQAGDAATAKSGSSKRGSRGDSRACAQELTSTATLRLRDEESSGTIKGIIQALRTVRPDLGEDMADRCSAAFLAESFVAYASERQPEVLQQWCGVLAEVVRDAGTHLDEDDDESATRRVVGDLFKRRILAIPEPTIEVGAVVLAVLAEDGEWHQALVEERLSDSQFRVVFLEYGKPQKAPASDIRTMDIVVDDEGSEENLQEGECEICHRRLLLTFHHLIPKDTHPTYLKKRLPRGIEGEPTRHFLNTYGTMVCRKCHSMVHSLASNAVLATDYNTLEKILAHPVVQKWAEWAAKQRDGRRA
mmetsp:Transcript_71158/g.230305  ORF Transcript_71158/g.230305 Transcript_71158/m.230305 type:complete len:416 (-) Transcript_71158:80-1327(-)